MPLLTSLAVSLALLLPCQQARTATPTAAVPAPRSLLGFDPGDDGRLVRWAQVVSYFQAVDAASDRVTVRDLGCTTECRPYLVAIVTSEANMAILESLRRVQARIAQAEPSAANSAHDLQRMIDQGQSRPVVLITNSIHSTETASTLTAIELLHRLASGGDPETLEILDQTILLLVPSANPDGVDIVVDWYDRSRGTPWEGGGLPRLYHPYAGHDTNRDWYMLNLKETQLLTKLLYEEWFPTITYDVHQMGSRGARIFVPPFFDPVNPNIDPRVHQSIALLGSHMAADLTAAGRQGILTSAIYDNWWNGGNRTTPQRHNMVGLLTESASVRLASPIEIPRSRLQGGGRGFRNHDRAANFPDPWPGGRWTLRDIVTDQLICARSVLLATARYDRQFQSQYLAMGRDAVARGTAEPPYGWIIPTDQADPGRAADLVRILNDTGIIVHQTTEPYEVVGRQAPRGSWLLRSDQPYRGHLKDMMEVQRYPDRRGPSGSAEPPYDVAGWTLPLLMGVEALELVEPELPPGKRLDSVDRPRARISEDLSAAAYLMPNVGDDVFRVLNRWLLSGLGVKRLDSPFEYRGETFPAGTFLVAASAGLEADLSAHPESSAVRLVGVDPLPTLPPATPVAPARLGLYQPWVPSMDEGWTRWVLENYGFLYDTLHNETIRNGDLRASFDAIILPSVGSTTLDRGYASRQTAPEYVGGLGQEGFEALSAFVSAGGTLIALENSCQYLMEGWDLGLSEPLSSLPTQTFFGPGSIVRIEYASPDDPPGGLLEGVAATGHAFFDHSLGFQIAPGRPGVYPLARYATSEPLVSGWLQGPDHLAGLSACVAVETGLGRIVLFGFPPQHRGQTRGTFRPLFNAIMHSSIKGRSGDS